MCYSEEGSIASTTNKSMKRLVLENDVDRPLSGWVHQDKSFFVKSFLHYEQEVILPEEIFVSLDAVFPVHQAAQVPLKTLDQSWIDTKEYITNACILLKRPNAGYPLSPSERSKVLATIGEPPGPAWPIYLLAVGDFPSERIIYIGKTNSGTHRFTSGHTAITALPSPRL
jgi:hypothetical protein